MEDDEKEIYHRDFEYLKFYQFEKPKLTSEKKNYKEKPDLAKSKLAIRQADYA